MAEQNWEELGRRLRDAVDRAVEHQDFKALEKDVRRVVDRVVRKPQAHSTIVDQTRPQELAKLYKEPSNLSVRAIVLMVVGLPVFSYGALALLDGELDGRIVWDHPGLIAILAGLALVGGIMTFLGCRRLSLVERYRRYRQALGFSSCISIGILANDLEKSVAYVRRDLKRMIRKGFFRQGHLNREGTHLITSDATYAYFEESRLQLEQRQRLEKQEKKKVKAAAPADPKVREVLDRGAEFLAKIRKCNEDIPGAEISAKIDRMEHIVQRIFQRVERHPEVVPDLKKLMDHYLPMAVKLLQAYADLDAQPVQGENIRSTKQEIDAALDTLNFAFEKLLDQIFEDTALDVSSDISVLNTLLAQDGLTEDDF